MDELLTMTVAELKEALGYTCAAIERTRIRQMPYAARRVSLGKLCVRKQNIERAIARKTMGMMV